MPDIVFDVSNQFLKWYLKKDLPKHGLRDLGVMVKPGIPGFFHDRSSCIYTCMAYGSFGSEHRSPTESSRRVGMSAMTVLDAPLVAVVVDPSSTATLLARELHRRGSLRG